MMKKIASTCLIIFLFSNFKNDLLAQKLQERINWQNLDLKTDGFFGISTEKAYKELLKGRIPTSVVVAVIDGGVDIRHEDLKESMWINTREIPKNKKDDDTNGYVDDLYGWNFMGNSKGSFHQDNAELVRSLRSELKKDEKSEKVAELKRMLEEKRNPLLRSLEKQERQKIALSSICKNLGKLNPSPEELRAYKYRNESELDMLVFVVKSMKTRNQDFKTFSDEFEHKYWSYRHQVDEVYNLEYNPRKDKEYKNKHHGNNDVIGLEPSHGTHAAGIIAAYRDNDMGINGIAATAKIMSIRAIPEGDMFDEDLASGIRYAVDNGAKVINISAAKTTSPLKKQIDLAVQYAMSKNVLIVHSAGNDGKLEQSELNYPNRSYSDGGEAEAWIEVGASGPKDDESLLPWFSNYGKRTADVFAPGVRIYSTYPNNQYKYESGTSMAAPVVSGLAALIWAYHPMLTAVQVKNIILRSVRKVNHSVKNRSGEKLYFSDICVSGGIVNAFDALVLADKVYNK